MRVAALNIFNYIFIWGGICTFALAIGLDWTYILVGFIFVVSSKILDELYCKFVETRTIDRF